MRLPPGKEKAMKAQSIMALLLTMSLLDDCGTTLSLPPAEKMKVKLTDQYVELVGEDSMSAYQVQDTTRPTSPAIPLYSVSIVPPAGREPGAHDSVTVNAVITKRGNVKRAWIVASDNDYFNKCVLKSVVQWKYQPALYNGVPFDTLILIRVPLK
jgi:Gram-negative bacterial TonB protein C-terminal